MIKYLLSLEKIKGINESLTINKSTNISEANLDVASLICYCLNERKENILVVAPNLYEAQIIYDKISPFSNAYFYPVDDFMSIELLAESLDFKIERINTIKSIISNPNKKIIVTTLQGLLTKIPKKEEYIKHIVSIKTEDTFKPALLKEILVSSGYKSNYTVEKPGEFSARGGILDIYPINSNAAYRIDFFGDDVENIKEFDIESQRSKKNVESVDIYPISEYFFSEEDKETILSYSEALLDQTTDSLTIDKLKSDISDIRDDNKLGYKQFAYLNPDNSSLSDFIENKITVFVDKDTFSLQEANIKYELGEYLNSFDNYYKNISLLNQFTRLDFGSELNVYFSSHENAISIHSNVLERYNGELETFIKGLEADRKKTIIISLSSSCKEVLKEELNLHGISYVDNEGEVVKGKICFVDEALSIPFYIDSINTVLYEQSQIFKEKPKQKTKYKEALEAKRLKSISELKIGDYVVHEDYGIGKFVEIKSMTFNQNTSDFIHLEYKDNNSLYVPVDKFYNLSRYSGEEGFKPKLSSLYTQEWKKTKAAVAKETHELAGRLISLYSSREQEQGFKFEEDSPLQKQLESEFKYELTEDQEKAINEVKEEMTSGKLMDRLICGDVGFGKTEVALRAAFKAVLSGKQVAYLCPTTLLARQHYYTFCERMAKYGVEIGLISRFVKPSQIKDNLYKLSTGRLDIIIGTHRLLSSDVSFSNLGLLIIDEEQRFGVEAKEIIKEHKMNVDVLTLTATPIPRTLQMAITGIKNVSLIETAPKHRYPTQTYVMERNDFIIKEAIERELSKGGQVFYLYNRVEDIDQVAKHISEMVPNANISIIHGKMSKDSMEKTINEFLDCEIDILVSTSIVETGIDIPNVNTLIIHDADRYGLSQLYQIKGRVGRSDKISYAYLMYDKKKTLTEDAIKRLQAIKDFTELGSGFKIAVRDLTIRGAGEILGKEQSGFMNRVGVELYLKMLNDEVQSQQGNTKKPIINENIIEISKHISDTYISDDYVRTAIHTKISKLDNYQDYQDLLNELTDRFGEPDKDLVLYIAMQLCQNMINKLYFKHKVFTKSSFLLMIHQSDLDKCNTKVLFETAFHISRGIDFNMKMNNLYITFSDAEPVVVYDTLSRFLTESLNKGTL